MSELGIHCGAIFAFREKFDNREYGCHVLTCIIIAT